MSVDTVKDKMAAVQQATIEKDKHNGEPPKLPEIATVHEKTVQKAEEHIKAAATKPKRRRRKPVRKATTSKQITVDPRVMEKAKELCDGQFSRLQIVSETEVIILNPGAKKFAGVK
jgi:hypothetical protein